MDKYIVLDRYCGWPNLTVNDNGDFVMTVFNKPYHGLAEGEVECFISSDGQTWEYLGTPVKHRLGENRMNVACGFAENQDLIVIVSGWNKRSKIPEDSEEFAKSQRIKAAVCRKDINTGNFESQEINYHPDINKRCGNIVPYGNIIKLSNGKLACPFYCREIDENNFETSVCYSYILFSEDDGYTWKDGRTIGEGNHHETSIINLGDGKLLAACRAFSDHRVDLFVSWDDGQQWYLDKALTLSGMSPANLILLNTGEILLTYGIRQKGLYGIGARISRDGGGSWSKPAVLLSLNGATDGGYPSCVQKSDGQILTAFYANRCANHYRYFVGNLHWNLDEFF